MWKLNKPDINRAKKEDIKKLVQNTKLVSFGNIENRLKVLYKNYDTQNGQVNNQQLGNIQQGEAQIIYNAYNLTYKGKNLNYIRAELFENVFSCPYCGINQAETLDHYMPKTKYKALAVCRMNLIPMCPTCNRLKKDKTYNNFVHCYYQEFPRGIKFLKADVKMEKNVFTVSFDYDFTHFPKKYNSLINKLKTQQTEVNLFSRMRKAAISFINDLCEECCVNNNEDLKKWLERRKCDYIKSRGLNDWQSAIWEGMLTFPDLDIKVIESYKKKRTYNVGA